MRCSFEVDDLGRAKTVSPSTVILFFGRTTKDIELLRDSSPFPR